MQNTPVCCVVLAHHLPVARPLVPVVEIIPCPGIPGEQGSSSGPGKLAVSYRSGEGCD